MDRLVSKWQNRALALSQGKIFFSADTNFLGCPATVKRVETDDAGDADWDDDCKLADEFEDLEFDDNESEATLSVTESERSPPKSLSRSHSWTQYSTHDELEIIEPILEVTPSENHDVPDVDVKVALLQEIITSVSKGEKKPSESAFKRSISNKDHWVMHGWMTHKLTRHFRNFDARESQSTDHLLTFFESHNNVASSTIRSRLQETDRIIVSNSLLSNRYPPKYIQRFHKPLQRRHTIQVALEDSADESHLESHDETINLNGTSEVSENQEVLSPRSRFSRPFLPLRRSISMSLRAGIGRFIGNRTAELISTVPSGIDTLAASMSKPLPPLPQFSPKKCIIRNVVNFQRVRRYRSRKLNTSHSKTRPPQRRHLSHRISNPMPTLTPEEIFMETQSHLLHEMQQRIVKLTRYAHVRISTLIHRRALEVAKRKYHSIHIMYEKYKV